METISKARLKQLRALTSRKGRDEHGLFIAEGPYLLEEALKAQVMPRFVVVNEKPEGPREKVQALVERCAKESIECVSAGEAEFAECADTVNSQGVLAVFAIPHYELAPLLERHDLTLLVLDNIREPGNLGAICRHAAAFDCGGLLLLKGCVDAWNNKAVRASMGGVFHVPVFADLTPEDVMQQLNEHGVWPYVAARGGKPAFEIDFPPKTAFIIGGETEGVQPFWNERDVIGIGLPQTDKVESCNAAVAASILMAWRFQGRRKGG